MVVFGAVLEIRCFKWRQGREVTEKEIKNVTRTDILELQPSLSVASDLNTVIRTRFTELVVKFSDIATCQ